jgi:hypothetical protein
MPFKARVIVAITAIAALLGAPAATAAVSATTWGAPPAHHAVATTWGKHAANTWG